MATIYYHDTGDYLSRDEKLKRIRTNHSALGGMERVTIIPNEKNDWINQRDGVFDTMIEIMPNNTQCVFSKNIVGLTTARDAREHHKPRYILDLLLSVINVSVQSVDIVNNLPKLKFD